MRHQPLTYFAKTNFHSKEQEFGIKLEDRFLHMYVVGKTGVGKSSLIKNLILQDIKNNIGCCLLDPHGDLSEEIISKIAPEFQEKCIYFNLGDTSLPFRYNPFKNVSKEKRSLVASGILDVLKKLWHDAWGVKLEHILRFSILTLLDQPHATFEDIPTLLLDSSFRKKAINYIENKNVKQFWEKEYPRYLRNDILPALNKIGAFLVHPVIRRVLIENPEELSMRKIMDEGKIFIINLAKGQVGYDVANVVGALLVTSMGSAAFTRVDTREEHRVPFIMHLDEFHNFTTMSVMDMLSELRKFKVGMVLAHQYLEQLDKPIRHAIIGNAGTIIAFRVGSFDARIMASEMIPIFNTEDFVNLPNYHIHLKLMIDGKPSRPFSAETLASV